MGVLDVLQTNLLSPVVLSFALGVAATLVRSDLRIPEAIHSALSIYLLLAIGLKGGAEIARTPIGVLLAPALASLALGALTAWLSWLVARHVMRLAVADAAALAAHYGSVSVVTFTAALTFLEATGVEVESFVPTLVVLLEIPGILVGLMLARAAGAGDRRWSEALHEVVTGRSVLLLVGGLLIGALAGPRGLDRVSPLFVEPFQGLVMLFLLEMGMVAARRLSDLRTVGAGLVAFAIAMPLVNGFLGVLVGGWVGLSTGGAAILGALTASASYIAAPSAVRLAIPEANPSFYLTAALGVTFPFNLAVGIPLYLALARALHGGG